MMNEITPLCMDVLTNSFVSSISSMNDSRPLNAHGYN